MTNNQPEHEHAEVDPLDRLLNDAVAPSVDSDQIKRLGREWDRITRRRRMKHSGITVAVLLVTVTAGILWRSGLRDSDIVTPDLAQNDPTPAAELPREAQQPREARQVVPRDAMVEVDPFEQLVCVAVRRKGRARQEQQRQEQQRQQKATQEATQDTVAEKSFDQLLAIAAQQLASDEDLAEFFQEYRQRLTEERLTQAVIKPNDSASGAAALQLLSFVVTERSLPLLLNLRSRPEAAELATEMVLRVADETTLFQLARQEIDRNTLRQMCVALLQRGSDPAVHLFLQLVDDQRTSAVAVAAVNDVQNLPVDRLLDCLQARQRNVRLTAGFVLGRSNNAEVARRLMQYVQFNQSRRAALVGLLASDSELAKQFVDHARSNVYLAAPLHAAQSVVRSFPTES